MAFGISAGTAALIGGGLAAAGSVAGAVIGGNAAQSAADTQAGAAQAGVQEQNYEFNKIRDLLKPYVDAGTGALTGYNGAMSDYQGGLGGYRGVLSQLNSLTGANGSGAQQSAINGLTSNPLYTTSMQLGQQSILANASATGGLRGGNTIASLGYLPGQVLSNVMQTQIGNLGTSLNGQGGLLSALGNAVTQQGNLVNLGENAAAGTGQAAMTTGNNITSLIGQQGAAQAGGILGTSNAITGGINNLTSALGNYLNPSPSGSYQFALPAYLNAAGIGSSSPAGLYGVGAGMNLR
ncbi:MAG: hypothetical protein EPN70_03540 [Paraburkholderia sp.]|uniref:hypothetical protein n=1 Tax=Paraburkholderia sp. TaxID=1926495 RepID=UPI0012079FE0|nr:hypothetical protein [Paraburkholderia sp.]TAM07258.1 MAG: hypothetical protein EPN70_03540 [Paraburkholderia sp.]TAM32603.1 MAG: hypothetical protein EPN59_01520 [Paraburkholderia sp.]